jgi:hypothetical protein
MRVSKTQRKADAAIDAFVARVNASPREPCWREEVPFKLYVGDAHPDGFSDWRVGEAPDPERVPLLEARLPGPFPRSFRSLVGRYLFMPLDVGGITLFANTDQDLHCDLRVAIFRDRAIFEHLSRHGLVQFARPDTGDYNAICFDLGRRRADKECAVVEVDHESILIDGKVRVVREVAPSFLDLIRQRD